MRKMVCCFLVSPLLKIFLEWCLRNPQQIILVYLKIILGLTRLQFEADNVMFVFVYPLKKLVQRIAALLALP
jgi:hypothetical protein